jgi:hypothetical protein
MFGLAADRDWLSIGSDSAQAVTGIVAGWAGIRYLYLNRSRRESLQRYLVKERRDSEAPGGQGTGTQSIVHLMGSCSMTEAQVLEAAFGNKSIRTWVAVDDDTGRADTLMFRIDDRAWQRLKK